MADPIKIRREGQIVKVVLNRPESYNALNPELVKSFVAHMGSLADDDSVRGVVITGEGKAFCAGGDLKWAASYPKGASAGFHLMAGRFHQGVLEIRRMSKPVIAAVNGVAAGAGFSMALACDFRILARSATMKEAYTSAGLCIDGGGTFTLPRLVGLARALEIAAFDRPIPAEQAWAWGLATKVVDDGQVVDEAVNMAQELARNSMNSFGWTKRLLTDSFNTPFEAHIEREREGIAACANHPDGQEGMKAFLEKRKPTFY